MEHGSNILSENKNNMNCVHVAASNGHLKLSKILIEKYRLDFKTRTKDGWSVLHYVARIGDVKFFQYLVENGIDCYSINEASNGENCLHVAAYYGCFSLCKLLLEKYSFDAKIKAYNGWSAAHFAAQNGDLDVFQYLIERSGDDFLMKDGHNCLHFAALGGHLSLCKLLLERYSFDIHMKTTDGSFAIHWAARQREMDVFQYLADKGADLHSKKNNGENCLHLAAKNNNLPLCKLLLEKHSLDIHAKAADGSTAIHSAARG